MASERPRAPAARLALLATLVASSSIALLGKGPEGMFCFPEAPPLPRPPPEAVAVFMHSLKSGGTTLSDAIAAALPGNIVPGSARADLFNASRQARWPAVPDPAWRVLFAHVGWSFLHELPFPVAPIALVRHPARWLDSALSAAVLQHIKERYQSNQTALLEVLGDYQTFVLSANGTAYLELEHRPPTESAVKEALENARKAAWIGVLERFDESLCLLFYTFGWPLPPPGSWSPQHVRAPAPVRPEVAGAVQWWYNGDLALWNLANERLTAGLQRMQEELACMGVDDRRPWERCWNSGNSALPPPRRVL